MDAKIHTINLARLSSGDDLSLQVYQFLGKKAGKKVYIQANLHGAEIVGNVVINELMAWLNTLNEEALAGEIWLVPGCNPLGMNQRSHFFSSGRYNSYDGKDWNRIFLDYELETEAQINFAQKHLHSSQEIIYKDYLKEINKQLKSEQELIHQPSSVPYSVRYRQVLQSLCFDADVAIDIHSSSNQGIDYLFTFPKQNESARAFLIDVGLVVKEPDGYTFDEAFIKPWLSLEKTFSQLGRSLHFDLESWTLELGSGMSANQESVKAGVKGIKNYLAQKDIVETAEFPLVETEQHQIYLADKSQLRKYYAPTGGIVKNCPPLKTNFQTGDSLYQVLELNKQKAFPTVINVTAEASGFIFDVGTNQAVNEGEYVLSVLETGENHD